MCDAETSSICANPNGIIFVKFSFPRGRERGQVHLQAALSNWLACRAKGNPLSRKLLLSSVATVLIRLEARLHLCRLNCSQQTGAVRYAAQHRPKRRRRSRASNGRREAGPHARVSALERVGPAPETPQRHWCGNGHRRCLCSAGRTTSSAR